jgi:hypothetical protein
MIQWYREGLFPINKLVSYYHVSCLPPPQDVRTSANQLGLRV